MITVEKAKIVLTETTVREILAAIEKAKAEEAPFEDFPRMPGADSTPADYKRYQLRRGIIHVIPGCSSTSGFHFEVELETRPHTQESQGYRLWCKHCGGKGAAPDVVDVGTGFPTSKRCPHCCGRKK